MMAAAGSHLGGKGKRKGGGTRRRLTCGEGSRGGAEGEPASRGTDGTRRGRPGAGGRRREERVGGGGGSFVVVPSALWGEAWGLLPAWGRGAEGLISQAGSGDTERSEGKGPRWWHSLRGTAVSTATKIPSESKMEAEKLYKALYLYLFAASQHPAVNPGSLLHTRVVLSPHLLQTKQVLLGLSRMGTAASTEGAGKSLGRTGTWMGFSSCDTSPGEPQSSETHLPITTFATTSTAPTALRATPCYLWLRRGGGDGFMCGSSGLSPCRGSEMEGDKSK